MCVYVRMLLFDDHIFHIIIICTNFATFLHAHTHNIHIMYVHPYSCILVLKVLPMEATGEFYPGEKYPLYGISFLP